MIRILGVGSPFGADQLAWQAIDHLKGMNFGDCDLIKLDRPGSGLLAYFRDAEHVILLDAVAIDGDPGNASLLEPQQLQRFTSSTSSHGFDVAHTIALAQALDQLPDRLHIIGIHTGIDLDVAPALDTESLEQLVLSLL